MSNKMTKTLTAISTKTKVGVTVALAALGIAAATLPMNLFSTAVKFTPTKQISETSYDLRATFDAKKIKNHTAYGFYLSNMFARDCNALAKHKDTLLINSKLATSNSFITGTNVTPETNYYACPWVKNSQGRVFAGHVVKFTTMKAASVVVTPPPANGLCPTSAYGGQLFQAPNGGCMSWKISNIGYNNTYTSGEGAIMNLTFTTALASGGSVTTETGANINVAVLKVGTNEISSTGVAVNNGGVWEINTIVPRTPGSYYVQANLFCDLAGVYASNCRDKQSYGSWVSQANFEVVVAPAASTTPVATPTVGTLNVTLNAQSPAGVQVAGVAREVARYNLTATGGDVAINAFDFNFVGGCKLEPGTVLSYKEYSSTASLNSVPLSDNNIGMIQVGGPLIPAGTTKVVSFITDTANCVSSESNEAGLQFQISKVYTFHDNVVTGVASTANALSLMGIKYVPVSTVGTLNISLNAQSPAGLKVGGNYQVVQVLDFTAGDKAVSVKTVTVDVKQYGTCNLQNKGVGVGYYSIDGYRSRNIVFQDLSSQTVEFTAPVIIEAGSTKKFNILMDTRTCTMDSSIISSVKGVGVLDNTNVIISGLPVIGGAISY